MSPSIDILGDAAAKEVAKAPRKFLFIVSAKPTAILDTADIPYHRSRYQ